MLRLGRIKVIFNLDVDDVIGIVGKFSRFKAYNEYVGFGKYCQTMEEDGIRIESKLTGNEEYFLVTKIM